LKSIPAAVILAGMDALEALGLAGFGVALAAAVAEIARHGRRNENDYEPGGIRMADKVSLITVEFLRWAARAPRSVAEAREAWRSTCPTTSAWEDAISDDLIAFGLSPRTGGTRIVVLTDRGRAVLDGAKRGAVTR
jgi:hypothetical protein